MAISLARLRNRGVEIREYVVSSIGWYRSGLSEYDILSRFKEFGFLPILQDIVKIFRR